MPLLWLLVVIIAISYVVYHAHLKLNITYKKVDDNDIIIVQLSTLYGIIRYKIQLSSLDFINKIDHYIINFKLKYRKKEKTKNISIVKRSNTIDGFFDRIDSLFNKYKLYKKSIEYIIRKTQIKNLSVRIKYGIKDAYIAAICYGLFYILITNFIIYTQLHMNLQVNDIAIKPIFNKELLNLEFNCIIDIKLGHIITALKMFIKTSRGSEIDGTAHRRSYENNYGEY